jgi:transposase
MSNKAALDVHKKVLMAVVATRKDAAGEALEYQRRRFGAGAQERIQLAAWLREHGVTEVVMESTAQYWKPVWLDLEPHFQLHLAQAHSNKAPKGRKHDFKDAERLVRRLLAGELILSFVPEAEQREWRTMTRGRQQLVRERVRLQNQIEALLEEARIKVSGVLSDLLGASGRRMLQAIAAGEADPARLAALGDERLRCSREELSDALNGQPTPAQRQILGLHLERLDLLDRQIDTFGRMAAEALSKHEDAVIRLARVPGLGVDSAQQIIAEAGPEARSFPSASQFASWVGTCPGSEESAEQNHSSRSPKGNAFLRRILTQAAQAAVKTNGSHFQNLFRRLAVRLGYKGAIWAVAHRLSRLIWKILHDGVSYIEQGAEPSPQARKIKARKLTAALRKLGFAATLTPISPPTIPAAQG